MGVARICVCSRQGITHRRNILGQAGMWEGSTLRRRQRAPAGGMNEAFMAHRGHRDKGIRPDGCRRTETKGAAADPYPLPGLQAGRRQTACMVDGAYECEGIILKCEELFRKSCDRFGHRFPSYQSDLYICFHYNTESSKPATGSCHDLSLRTMIVYSIGTPCNICHSLYFGLELISVRSWSASSASKRCVRLCPSAV